jgi:hypothetical protein
MTRLVSDADQLRALLEGIGAGAGVTLRARRGSHIPDTCAAHLTELWDPQMPRLSLSTSSARQRQCAPVGL